LKGIFAIYERSKLDRPDGPLAEISKIDQIAEIILLGRGS